MSIENIIRQVKTVQGKLTEQSREFLNKDKKEVLDLVRIDQLFQEGEDADKIKLKPYTPFTRSVKRSQGRDPNVVTLFDEGDFYRGFNLSLISDDVLNIFSTDSKTRDLLEKYGSRILDLNDENEEKVNKKLENQLITWVLQTVKI